MKIRATTSAPAPAREGGNVELSQKCQVSIKGLFQGDVRNEHRTSFWPCVGFLTDFSLGCALTCEPSVRVRESQTLPVQVNGGHTTHPCVIRRMAVKGLGGPVPQWILFREVGAEP